MKFVSDSSCPSGYKDERGRCVPKEFIPGRLKKIDKDKKKDVKRTDGDETNDDKADADGDTADASGVPDRNFDLITPTFDQSFNLFSPPQGFTLEGGDRISMLQAVGIGAGVGAGVGALTNAAYQGARISAIRMSGYRPVSTNEIEMNRMSSVDQVERAMRGGRYGTSDDVLTGTRNELGSRAGLSRRLTATRYDPLSTLDDEEAAKPPMSFMQKTSQFTEKTLRRGTQMYNTLKNQLGSSSYEPIPQEDDTEMVSKTYYTTSTADSAADDELTSLKSSLASEKAEDIASSSQNQSGDIDDQYFKTQDDINNDFLESIGQDKSAVSADQSAVNQLKSSMTKSSALIETDNAAVTNAQAAVDTDETVVSHVRGMYFNPSQQIQTDEQAVSAAKSALGKAPVVTSSQVAADKAAISSDETALDSDPSFSTAITEDETALNNASSQLTSDDSQIATDTAAISEDQTSLQNASWDLTKAQTSTKAPALEKMAAGPELELQEIDPTVDATSDALKATAGELFSESFGVNENTNALNLEDLGSDSVAEAAGDAGITAAEEAGTDIGGVAAVEAAATPFDVATLGLSALVGAAMGAGIGALAARGGDNQFSGDTTQQGVHFLTTSEASALKASLQGKPNTTAAINTLNQMAPGKPVALVTTPLSNRYNSNGVLVGVNQPQSFVVARMNLQQQAMAYVTIQKDPDLFLGHNPTVLSAMGINPILATKPYNQVNFGTSQTGAGMFVYGLDFPNDQMIQNAQNQLDANIETVKQQTYIAQNQVAINKVTDPDLKAYLTAKLNMYKYQQGLITKEPTIPPVPNTASSQAAYDKYKSAISSAQTSVNQATSQLDQATTKLHDDQSEVSSAQTSVNQATSQLEDDQKKQTAAKSQISTDKTNLASAQAKLASDSTNEKLSSALTAAQQKLTSDESNVPSVQELLNDYNQLSSAQQKLSEAQSKLTSDKSSEPTSADIQSANAKLSSAQSKLSSDQASQKSAELQAQRNYAALVQKNSASADAYNSNLREGLQTISDSYNDSVAAQNTQTALAATKTTSLLTYNTGQVYAQNKLSP